MPALAAHKIGHTIAIEMPAMAPPVRLRVINPALMGPGAGICAANFVPMTAPLNTEPLWIADPVVRLAMVEATSLPSRLVQRPRRSRGVAFDPPSYPPDCTDGVSSSGVAFEPPV